MKLHHFFSLFLCPFYVFVQKGSSQCTFLVNFSSQFTFLVNYSFIVYVLVNFSSVYVWVNFQYAWFNSFQLFTHSKNSLQYQFDNSHSVSAIFKRPAHIFLSARSKASTRASGNWYLFC